MDTTSRMVAPTDSAYLSDLCSRYPRVRGLMTHPTWRKTEVAQAIRASAERIDHLSQLVSDLTIQRDEARGAAERLDGEIEDYVVEIGGGGS